MSVPKHPRCVQSLACSTFSWSGLEIMSIERTNERETNKNFGPRPPYWEFGRETEVRRKADSSGIRRNLICLGSFGSNFSNKAKPKHKPFPLGLFGSIWIYLVWLELPHVSFPGCFFSLGLPSSIQWGCGWGAIAITISCRGTRKLTTNSYLSSMYNTMNDTGRWWVWAGLCKETEFWNQVWCIDTAVPGTMYNIYNIYCIILYIIVLYHHAINIQTYWNRMCSIWLSAGYDAMDVRIYVCMYAFMYLAIDVLWFVMYLCTYDYLATLCFCGFMSATFKVMKRNVVLSHGAPSRCNGSVIFSQAVEDGRLQKFMEEVLHMFRKSATGGSSINE